MRDLRDAFQNYSPLITLALAVIVFAAAPLVIYLARNKEFSRRDLLVTGIQSAWILLANALCALASVDYCIGRFGHTTGVLLTILAAAFGGTLALGLYETVLNQRLAIGRSLEKKLLSFLATKKEEEE